MSRSFRHSRYDDDFDSLIRGRNSWNDRRRHRMTARLRDYLETDDTDTDSRRQKRGFTVQ